jgi:hypothetical protein
MTFEFECTGKEESSRQCRVWLQSLPGQGLNSAAPFADIMLQPATKEAADGFKVGTVYAVNFTPKP